MSIEPGLNGDRNIVNILSSGDDRTSFTFPLEISLLSTGRPILTRPSGLAFDVSRRISVSEPCLNAFLPEQSHWAESVPYENFKSLNADCFSALSESGLIRIECGSVRKNSDIEVIRHEDSEL